MSFFGNVLLRGIVDTYNQFQQVRIASFNRLRAMQINDEYESIREKVLQELTEIEKLEKSLVKEMRALLRHNELYTNWLRYIRGLGPTLSAKLLALHLDVNKHISSWNAFFGLVPFYYECKCEKGHRFLYPRVPLHCSVKDDPQATEPCKATITECKKVEAAPKPKRGYKAFWNPKAKTLAYLISESFRKQGRYYRLMYYKFAIKELQLALAGEKELYNLRHLDYKARRLTVKLFLSHTHEMARRLSGLQPEKPYQFEYLNHDDYISPDEVLEFDKPKENVLKAQMETLKDELDKLKAEFISKRTSKE